MPFEKNRQIFFFIPSASWPPSLPSSPDDYWEWAQEYGLGYSGRYLTTVLTHLHLQAMGLDTALVDTVPCGAIVITHTDFLPHSTPEAESPWTWKPTFEGWLAESFVVCVQVDRPRNPYAQMHVVQNADDARSNGQGLTARVLDLRLHYIPPWTQPDLLVRDRDRGDRFQNVAYLGNPGELDESFHEPAWDEHLRRHDLEWVAPEPHRWNDFREIDAVVAARDFNYPGSWLWKGGTKLFNAWLAGVPAVLGSESAYRAERRSELDYIEVSSFDETCAALSRLRGDPELRAAMVANGRLRARDVSAPALARRWRQFIEEDVLEAYEEWRTWGPARRRRFAARRGAGVRLHATARPLLKTRNASLDLWRHRGDWN